MKTKELLCQQYVVQSDSVIYTIRPKDDKHPALLPIGEQARFRLDKDKILLRVEDGDEKEREYLVVSMTPNDGSAQNCPSSRRPKVPVRQRSIIGKCRSPHDIQDWTAKWN